ncbi:MAG: GNAT family N-acetyltransferase [Armatimonadota bacterium]|nr:MAG: GNAT family N-acetyltransferase [Armatimonadota bacterium]
MNEVTVLLRPITEEDLPDRVRWFNDPGVTEWLVREGGERTLEQEREWFARISSPECTQMVLAIEAAGHHIGATALHFSDDAPIATFGIVIGEKSRWGHGWGIAATREMLRIGFEERGLHRIQLEVWAGNPRAIRCYEKCGFRHEGMLRQAVLKRGALVDLVVMGLLREEWQALQQCPSDGLCELGPQDVADIIGVWEQVGLWPHVGEDREVVRQALMLRRNVLCGWRMSGALVGTAIGAWDGFRGWLYRVAVLPAYRRQAIASALVTEIERRLAKAGAYQINLMMRTGDDQARALYARLGYEPFEAGLMRKRFPIPAGGIAER